VLLRPLESRYLLGLRLVQGLQVVRLPVQLLESQEV
jgi:hypothetical protein